MNESYRILIAEDERPMAKALQLKLEHDGHTVIAVGDGDDAIEALKTQKFDVVLLDLMMPHTDGFAVLEWKKQQQDNTPVIVATNLSQEEDKKRVKDLGAKGYFVKSDTSINDIISHIHDALLAV